MDEPTSSKNHWYLLTGLVFGLVIGLIISLLISPAVNAESLPHELDGNGKALYREQIALAYASNHDLNRALSRLELLKDENPAAALIAQAQNVVAQGGSVELSRSLAQLAEDIQQPGLSTKP